VDPSPQELETIVKELEVRAFEGDCEQVQEILEAYASKM
jgi:hypothetical protein